MTTKRRPPAAGARLAHAALACLVLLVACDSGTEPAPPTHRIEVSDGDGQTTVAGQVLAAPAGFQLFDDVGTPVEGAFLDVRAEGGGRALAGSVRTDPQGLARVGWRLGSQAGTQELVAVHRASGAEARATATAVAADPLDAIRIEGAGPGDLVGALIDGVGPVGPADDYGFLGVGSIMGVGDWRATSSARSEVALFRPGRVPRFVAGPPWTDGADTLTLPSAEPLQLPVTVWIVHGSTEDARTRLAGDLITAMAAYRAEGMGIEFDDVEFVDTVAADTSSFLAFTCASRGPLEAATGRRDDRLNVYVVREVDGSTSRGQACEIGGNFVALGYQAGNTLLAHEIGHNLALVHPPDDPAHYDATNVMHPASDVRAYFTEGQIFRAHLNERSARNALLDPADPGLLRTCFSGSSEACPLQEARLWPDGRHDAYPVIAGSLDRLEVCGTGRSIAGGVPTGPLGVEAVDGGPPAAVVAEVRRAAESRAREVARLLEALGQEAPSWTRFVGSDVLDPEGSSLRAERAVVTAWRDNGGKARR